MEQYIKKVTHLASHEGFRKYFKNTGWLFTGKVFNSFISFFVTAYVVRSLGPDKYGILSYAVSFAGLASIIANLGIDAIVARELVREPERRDTIIGTSIVVKIIAALVAFGVTAIASIYSGNNTYVTALTLIITGSYFFASFNIINLYFQAKAASSYPTIISFIVVLILAALKVGGIFWGAPLFFFAFIYLFEPILYAFGYLTAYGFYEGSHRLHWKFSKREALMLLRDSWPLLLGGIFIAIYSRIDQVMIGHMIDDKAVGLYDAGVRLAEFWYFIPSLVVSSFYPALINAQKVDSNLYDKRLGRLYFSLAWIGILVTIGIFVVSPIVVTLLYGGAYIGTIKVLQLYALATVGVYLTAPLYQHLTNENRTGIIFTSSVIGALSNIVLNIFLIPRYGINGAALATCISYSLIPLSILVFRSTRKHGLFLLKSIFIFK